MDEIVTKRIHVSGLTPAITAKDLFDRLGSFGTVQSVDGYGLKDAVGQPRKFVYVTLETTKGKLARCMNLLSGVTWKGAKLRLGEAKPDFRERIAQEHAAQKREAERVPDECPKKRRRLPRGVHALDMSLVTAQNVSTRGGWRVTPTGRLIRPMRMRPTHPLPEPLTAFKSEKERDKSKSKNKKRLRDPPTRARRRTIDPTKWGSQQLKGIFLENAAASVHVPRKQDCVEKAALESSDQHLGSSEGDDTEDEDVTMEGMAHVHSSSRASSMAIAPSTLPASSSNVTIPGPASGVILDLSVEKTRSLGLLQSLFGNKEQWGGPESIGSDVEDDVPHNEVNPISPISGLVQDDPGAAMEVDIFPEVISAVRDTVLPANNLKTKLRDLFAPREDTGFSLLGHLDLDLELEDVPFDMSTAEFSATPLRSDAAVEPPTLHTAPSSFLDPSRAFFFPSDKVGAKGRVSDSTRWRTWFYRTDSPEAIRARWEEGKGELTAAWKRRHREAVKSRRRRGGGGGEAD